MVKKMTGTLYSQSWELAPHFRLRFDTTFGQLTSPAAADRSRLVVRQSLAAIPRFHDLSWQAQMPSDQVREYVQLQQTTSVEAEKGKKVNGKVSCVRYSFFHDDLTRVASDKMTPAGTIVAWVWMAWLGRRTAPHQPYYREVRRPREVFQGEAVGPLTSG